MKKLLSLLLTGVLCGSLLAGCSGGAGSETTSAAS